MPVHLTKTRMYLFLIFQALSATIFV